VGQDGFSTANHSVPPPYDYHDDPTTVAHNTLMDFLDIQQYSFVNMAVGAPCELNINIHGANSRHIPYLTALVTASSSSQLHQ
jgi:hypothetical protein